MEEKLEIIAKNTSHKTSMLLFVHSNKSKFTTNFNPPIQLSDKPHEMALLNLETYYSFPNIDTNNNNFNYSCLSGPGPNGKFNITLPTGCYDIKEINKAIQKELKKNGHDEIVEFSSNSITLKTIMKFKPPEGGQHSYSVHFDHANTIGKTFGFNTSSYTNLTKTYYESENIVDILRVNTIQVHTDIISSSYVNGTSEPMIYSFFPNADPGYKIVEKPYHPIYLPVYLQTIPSITTRLTDQDGNELNLRGERVTIRYHLREI